MSHVNVTIHGRQYRMACEDGQEDHLRRLAKDLDQRIEQLKRSFGAIGDMRLIVMAALTVGDELERGGQACAASGRGTHRAAGCARCLERARAGDAGRGRGGAELRPPSGSRASRAA